MCAVCLRSRRAESTFSDKEAIEVPMSKGCALILALGCMACATSFKDGVFRKAAVAYRVGAPNETQWQPVRLRHNDLAWTARSSLHLLASNAVCEENTAASLKVLTRHLLMGFTDTVQLSETKRILDGREALHTVWTGKFNGVPVELELVVLKKNGCIHDFTYVSPLRGRAMHRASFQALVQSFRQQERNE